MDMHRAKTALRHVGRCPELLQCIRELTCWHKLMPAYAGLSSLSMPFTARTRSGDIFRLVEFYDAETLWQIYCRGIYEVRPDDRIIVDAGANIGLFVCYAASRAPQAVIHAFEPFPSTYERLVSTVRANGFESRVICHQYALHSCRGVAPMSSAASASQMFHLDTHNASPSNVSVPTRTLAEVVEAIGPQDVDLLKMDIEGSEYGVLMSARSEVLRKFRRITVEFHEPPVPGFNKSRLAEYVRSAGFSLREDADAPGDYGLFHFERRHTPTA